jgi:hypothetical protein
MTFEDFLNKISPKIGPKNALDLARDSRIKSLERVLIEKCGIVQADIDSAVEKELEALAENIERMPPISSN